MISKGRIRYHREEVKNKIELGEEIKPDDVLQLDPRKDEDFLVEVIESKNPIELVETAVASLSREVPKQNRILKMVLDPGNGYSLDVRKRAMKLLCPEEDTFTFMKVLRNDPSFAIRVIAVNKVNDPNSNILKVAIEDEHPYVRGMAAEKINKHANADVLELLALEDPHPYVRWSAILRVEKNTRLFRKALDDSDAAVKLYAENRLKAS